MLSHALAQLLNEEIDQGQLGNRLIRSFHIQKNGSIDREVSSKMGAVPESNGSKSHGVNIISYKSKSLGNTSDHSEACLVIDIDADGQDNSANKSLDEIKKPDPIVIPDDFLCPISLELMRDPVIVATGQVYYTSNYILTYVLFKEIFLKLWDSVLFTYTLPSDIFLS